MLNDVVRIISGLNLLSNRKIPVVSEFITGLMVTMKKHSFETIGKISGRHPSRFSSLLNDPMSLDLSKQMLVRVIRRRLSKIKIKRGKTFLMMDATFTKRFSRHVENCKSYFRSFFILTRGVL